MSEMFVVVTGVLLSDRVSTVALDCVVGVHVVTGLALCLKYAEKPARAKVRATRVH